MDANKPIIVNQAEAEKFLNWMCLPKQPGPHRDAFEKVMRAAHTDDPHVAFISGLKAVSQELDSADKNPLLKLGMNLHALFGAGLMLGYLLTLASDDPELHEALAPLYAEPENITPISSARGFKS